MEAIMPESFTRKESRLSCGRLKIGVGILLTALTLIVYWQVGRFDFIGFDDGIYVSDNPNVKSGLTSGSIAWSFSFEDKDKTYWHPLTWLSHMLDVELFGLQAGPHHLTNVALHLVNTLLLFFVLARLTDAPWRSALVAALFAVHPINVESVAWVASRKNLLSTALWMLTTSVYIYYTKNPGMARYLILTLVFLLGLLTKPMLVTLPCTLLLLDFWPLKRLRFAGQELSQSGLYAGGSSFSPARRQWGLVVEKFPLLLLSLLVSWLASDSMKYTGSVIPFEAVPFTLRIQNALVSTLTYIGKIIWPAHLSVFYPYPEVLSFWQTTFSILLIGGVTGYACLELRKRPFFIVGWLWFLGTLVPVSGIIQVGLWPALADRWAYIPSIGLFIIIVWGGHEFLWQWRSQVSRGGVAAAALIIIISLAMVSHSQVAVWENGVSLFEHALEHTEGNFVAHNNLGAELYRQERIEDALFHFHEAVGINPNYFFAYNNIGIDSLYHEKFEEAEKWFAKALSINPRFADAHKKMAATKLKLKKVKEAIEHYSTAMEIDPQDKTIHNDFGCLLMAIGQPAKAVHFFRNALWIDPDFADANHNLGVAYLNLGQSDNAERHFFKALATKPEYAQQQQKLKEDLTSKAH
jgi:Tfp pilus assembly protein PilF